MIFKLTHSRREEHIAGTRHPKKISITKSKFTIDKDVYIQALCHGPVITAISLHDKISFDLKILISINDINIHSNAAEITFKLLIYQTCVPFPRARHIQQVMQSPGKILSHG